MINQDGIYLSCYGEISLDPLIKCDCENAWSSKNELIRVLMSFIILIFLLIEKEIELDKVTLSMPYIQLWISHDKKMKAITILGYVGSPT